MANKTVNFDIQVNSQSVDQAKTKVDGLNQSIQQTETTTKQFGNNVSIEYDKLGNATEVLINKELNLKQQVKALYSEMQKLSTAGKENTNEFRILAAKYNDTKDNLDRVNAKSRDLFASLSLIPGPIGDIAGKLNGAIGLMKTFTGFSIKDIGNQFKELNNDLNDIIKNIFGVNKELSNTAIGKAITTGAGGAVGSAVSGAAAGGAETAGAVAAGAALGTAAPKAVAELSTALTFGTAEYNKINEAANKLMEKNGLMIKQFPIMVDGVEKMSFAVRTTDGSLRALSEAEIAAMASGKALQVTEEGLIVTTWSLNGAIKALTSSVLFWIAVIAAAGYAVYKYLSAKEKLTLAEEENLEVQKKAAEIGNDNLSLLNKLIVTVNKSGLTQREKNKAVNEYNEKLGETLGKVKTYEELEKKLIANGPDYIEYLKLKSQAEGAYALSVEKTKEALLKGAEDPSANATFWDRLSGIVESKDYAKTVKVQGAINRETQKKELEKQSKDFFNIYEGFQTKMNQLAEKLKLPVPEIKIEGPKGGTKDADAKYQKLVADYDARIQLEIDQENTSRENLEKLLEERAQVVEKHEKYTAKQSELLREENKKKVVAALEEDSKRREAFEAKKAELEIAAIKDAEKRELSAREQKLKLDVIALNYDKQYQDLKIKDKAAADKILLDMEKTYQNDVLKIKEGYFLKQFQKDNQRKTDEIKAKEVQNQNLLDQDTQYLLEGQNGIFGKALVQTKKYLENKFVDMKKANEDQHFETSMQLQTELLTLNKAHEDKKLSDEEYANKKQEVNQKISENDQQLVEKQKKLDQTLLDAKKETAAMTMNIAENLVGVLSALGQFSTDWQITAAIAEAGLGIAKIITSTQVAIAEYSASVALLGPVGEAMALRYAVKAKIAAALGIAAITVGAIGRINQIKGQNSAGTEPDKGNKPNYGDGGMIDGPRHAQGGVEIVAEGGEAVMTRGAVTAFRPLLSMMNQMGGGTSFSKGAIGQASYDNPKTNNSPMEQPIIKTYVVSTELTNDAHRAARLKDLSTL